MKTPSLASLVGEVITIKAPALNDDKEFEVKLLAVEDSGLWIDYLDLNQAALKRFNVTTSRKTVIFFVPFSSISFVVESLDVPSLSETILTQ
jgi:hypothetical protein